MERLVKTIKNEKGSIIVIVALSLVVLVGISALAIDGGRLFLEKGELQKAVDAAALAGAQQLPNYSEKAEDIANQIIIANMSDLTEDNISTEIPDDHSYIRVEATSNVKFTLAKALNFDNTDVNAAAKVMIYPLTSYGGKGTVPFGIDIYKYNIENTDLENLSNGDQIELKWGISEYGNFGPLSIDGTGASIYKETIINGTNRVINVGDIIDTETGEMIGPTVQGINKRFEDCNWDGNTANILSHIDNEPDCTRLVIIPLYKPFNVISNQVKQVEVVGFASVFITELTKRNNDKGEKDDILKAIYIEQTVYGGSSSLQHGYGTYSYKLVE